MFPLAHRLLPPTVTAIKISQSGTDCTADGALVFVIPPIPIPNPLSCRDLVLFVVLDNVFHFAWFVHDYLL
jgi:hypothetical protein